jgi:hypothetical protein
MAGILFDQYILVTIIFCLLCRKYCLQACEVEEPEVRFNIDQYSDVVMIAKPVIYISVGEIVDTHSVRHPLVQ